MHKLKMWKNKILYGLTSLLATGTMVLNNALPAHASQLGDKAQALANTAQTEAFGLAEVVGLIGIVACGILYLAGQKEMAKKVLISVIVGFVILKYASSIWSVIKGGV